ncbi:MAG: tetratricopeptide repeat protein [Ktedonobacteraceae bacterium]
MSVRAVERALVYASAQVARLPDDPDHVMAQQRLGAVQVALGERFDSLGLAEQAAHFVSLGEETLRGTLAEDQPLGYLLLAELLISRERYDEAEQHLLKARELAQERDVQAQIEFDLASLALERKRFTDAQRYLEHLAEIAPDYPELWLTLGLVQSGQNNHPEAEVYYKRAMTENPLELRAYTELNALYMEQHEFDKARDILAQGIGALPQSAHLRALMSAVYLEKGDRRRALEYLNEAERLNPDLEIVQALHAFVKKLS